MGRDEKDIEELYEENVEKALENIINETFEKEFNNTDTFNEHMSIEDAENQLDEVYQNPTQDTKNEVDKKANKVNIDLPSYENDVISPEIAFKAGDIKNGDKNNAFKNQLSAENIEYLEYYDEDKKTDLNGLSKDESYNVDLSLEKINNNEGANTENQNNTPQEYDLLDGLFGNLMIDKSLPSNADEFYYMNDKAHKSDKRFRKNRTKIQVLKDNMVGIIIFCIVVVGSVIAFIDYENLSQAYQKTLVYELPTFSFSVFDENGMTPHNIKLNVSVGVASSDIKLVDSTECYNIIYDTVTNMDYTYFASPNAQYELKKDIKQSLNEKDEDDINYRIYISGIDVDRVNIPGETVDTKADDQDDKKESSEDLLNSMRYNSDEN